MSDLIERQAAIEALARMMPRSYTPDGSHPADEEIYKIQEIYVDCIESIEILPAVQPDHVAEIGKKAEGDCISRQEALKICRRYWHPTFNPIMEEIEKLPSVQPEQRWIPVTERLPENDNEVLITVWDAEDDYVEVYKGFYQGHEWWTQWCHGCSKIKDEPCGENIVIAWMPLPEPYRGGEMT